MSTSHEDGTNNKRKQYYILEEMEGKNHLWRDISITHYLQKSESWVSEKLPKLDDLR